MKYLLAILFVIVVAPVIGVGIVYGGFAVTFWDQAWIAHSDPPTRALFIFFAGFGAAFGFGCAGCLTAAVVD